MNNTENGFTIFYCEDDLTSNAVIESFLLELKIKYSNITYKRVSFDDIIIKKVLDTTKPDLLILDLLDDKDKKLKGRSILTLIKSSQNKIPTIIYSQGKTGSKEDVNLSQLKKDFSFILESIKKFNDASDEELKNVIEIQILKRLPVQYKLKNENDLILQLQISMLGEVNLNQIINKIKESLEIENEIILERMISGYSGAVLFKFINENTTYVLKVSAETLKLEEEFENAKKYYPKFPEKFFNYISPEKFYTANNNIIGILIKLVEGGNTLFDTIKDTIDFSNNLKPLLEEIFINNYSLKKHYKEQRKKNEKKGIIETRHWSFIFDKFKGSKYSIIENVIEELHPLISDSSMNNSNMKNLILNQSFELLDKNKLEKINSLVLCHGDLHSKNILIQGSHPFLIDTGGINYNYWCFDICRLIVDLFIKGIDADSKAFYDINKISKNVKLAKTIIERKKIKLDGKNDNFINSINWLVSNCSEIYDDLFSKFEFQLGLMKEFLQVSYRVGTIPPNKRAIALISANECMLIANETVKKNS